MASTSTAHTLWEALRAAAATDEDRGVTVVTGAGAREFRSWRRILNSAERVGLAMRRAGVEPGQRVLMSLPTGFDFLSVFFGAVGIGAVPIPFPTLERTENRRPGLSSPEFEAARKLGATVRVRSDVQAPGTPRAGGLLDPFEHDFDVADLRGEMPETPVDWYDSAETSTAYIQLTEGAAGPAAGVQLTHRGILANVRAMGHALKVSADDIGVSWIPLHNALGLVGVLLFGVVHQITLVFLKPEDFMRWPDSWLRAISRHRGTLSPAPNFAFHYTVRRCKESDLEGVDLSCWRVAMNGGEPVRGQHMESFVRRFGQYGLEELALTPVYGLSEATLGVAFERPDAAFQMDAINRRVLQSEGRAEPLPEQGAPSPAERMHLVSVGRPLPGFDLEIVDDEGQSLPERHLGEIALRGESVSEGYVRADRDTLEPRKWDDYFDGTHTRGEDDWLLTGDLGYLADGRLFVVGRACDRVVLRDGRRICPEEVELFVDAVDGVYAGHTAVFGLEEEGEGGGGDGAERLVVALELQSGTTAEGIERRVRELLDEHLDVEPDALACLVPRSIPRTKSGKVRRFLARRLYRDGLLDRRERGKPLARAKLGLRRAQREAEALGEELSRRFRALWEG